MRFLHVGYALAGVTTSVAAAVGWDRTHAVTKYALAPTLAARVASARPTARSAADQRNRLGRGLLCMALAGSTLGDHFMLAESRTSGPAARAHMRRGGASFAVQQLGIITALHRRGYRFTPATLRGGGMTLAALTGLDAWASWRQRHISQPDAATASWPDPILGGYGLALTAMATLTQGAPRPSEGKESDGARMIRYAGPLFVFSDAVIVARGVLPQGRARRLADGVVMATYAAALAGLVTGLTHGQRRPD